MNCERVDQAGCLPFPTVESLGNHEAAPHIVLREGKLRGSGTLPRLAAAGQISGHAFGRLVAVFRALGQQPLDQIGERLGDRGADEVGRHRRLGDMAVDHLERIDRLEREPAGEHLIEGDPERVEVGTVVDVPIHPPGLLG